MKVFKILSFVLVTSLFCTGMSASETGKAGDSGNSSSSQPTSSFTVRLSELTSHGLSVVRGLGSFLSSFLITRRKAVPADFVITKISAEQITAVSDPVERFIQMAKDFQRLDTVDDSEIADIVRIFKEFLNRLPTDGSRGARLIRNLEQICACTRSFMALHTAKADKVAVCGLLVATFTLTAVSGRPLESLIARITFDNGRFKTSGGFQAILKEVCVRWPGCASTVDEMLRLEASDTSPDEIAPLLVPHFLKLFDVAIELLKS